MTNATRIFDNLTTDGSPFAMREVDTAHGPMRGYARVHPTLRSLYDAARSHGDKHFAVMGDIRLSFTEVMTRAARLGHALIDDYGMTPGDRVAIAMQNRPEWMVAFIAVTAAGGVAVPLNSWGLGEELLYCLDDCGAGILIADEKRAARVRASRPDFDLPLIVAGDGAADFDAIVTDASRNGVWPDQAPAPTDIALIQYTSGTTGKAKGATFEHRAVCQALSNMGISGAMIGHTMMERMKAAGIKPEIPAGFQPSILLILPLFHVSGCHAIFLSSLMSGARVVMMHKWDAGDALKIIERERINAFPGVPTMVWDLLQHPDRGNYDLSSLSNIGVGGAAQTPERVRAMASAVPGAIAGTGYGLTEVGGTIATVVGTDYTDTPATAGVRLPAVDIRIIDADGKALEAGKEGEILIRSATLMTGYWGRDTDTREALRDGWFHTGDLGRLTADDRIFITGRIKDMVISGGENIACAEVESVIRDMPEVADVACIGLPDDRMGERLVAVIVPAPGTSLDPEAVTTFVAERLAGFKVPRQVILRDQPLPMTALLKVKKNILKQDLERNN